MLILGTISTSTAATVSNYTSTSILILLPVLILLPFLILVLVSRRFSQPISVSLALRQIIRRFEFFSTKITVTRYVLRYIDENPCLVTITSCVGGSRT
jgi:hypothetical protein